MKSRPKKATRRAVAPPRRDTVSRQKFAALSARVSLLVSDVTRNRRDLDIQLIRIAQLQEQLDGLKSLAPRAAISPPVPDTFVIMPKPTIES